MKDFESMKAYKTINLDDNEDQAKTMIKLIDDSHVIISDKTVKQLINDMTENGGIKYSDENNHLYWFNKRAIKSLEPVTLTSGYLLKK